MRGQGRRLVACMTPPQATLRSLPEKQQRLYGACATVIWGWSTATLLSQFGHVENPSAEQPISNNQASFLRLLATNRRLRPLIQRKVVRWHCVARREIAERSEEAPAAKAAQPSWNGGIWKALEGQSVGVWDIRQTQRGRPGGVQRGPRRGGSP